MARASAQILAVAVDASPSFRALLSVLAKHRVDFILVGGVAAIFEGALRIKENLGSGAPSLGPARG